MKALNPLIQQTPKDFNLVKPRFLAQMNQSPSRSWKQKLEMSNYFIGKLKQIDL